MFSVALLLLLAAGSCVKCETLTQPASLTVRPGQTLTITCQVSYNVDSYYTSWIRQPAGKGLEWIGMESEGEEYYKDSLKNKFSISSDSSSKTVTLTGQNLQPEDTAVYYCARLPDTFDYWGKGTVVTVSSATSTRPTVFPLVQCGSGTGSTVTVGCLATGFTPASVTFAWVDGSGTTLTDAVNYPSVQRDSLYSAVSQLRVTRSDWDQKKTFHCTATNGAGSNGTIIDPERVRESTKPPTTPQTTPPQPTTPPEEHSPPKVTLLSVPNGDTQFLICMIEEFSPKALSVTWKKNTEEVRQHQTWPSVQAGELYSAVSVLKVNKREWQTKSVYSCEVHHMGTTFTKKASSALVTVTLNPPNAKKIFSDNKVELDCTITGQDSGIVNETAITWQINGQDQTDNIAVREVDQYTKSSTLSQSLQNWKTVNKVRCSASRQGDKTLGLGHLTVNKGDKKRMTVTVHVLPEEDIPRGGSGDQVTLVCLVSSPVQSDYYITWTEEAGDTVGDYEDGIIFPQQKTQNGFSVTSVYTTTKKKWDENVVFNCLAWPAGDNSFVKSRGVSKVNSTQSPC